MDEVPQITVCRGLPGCDANDPASCPDCVRTEVRPGETEDDTFARIERMLKGDA